MSLVLRVCMMQNVLPIELLHFKVVGFIMS